MRLLDISLSILGLMIVAPLLLAIAALIRLTSGGPVLYRPLRVGRCGRLFALYKFRTMVPGADSIGPSVTGNKDGRITPIGLRLRRWKLDELPQLFNVLTGDMSLVGPRPEDPGYVETYSDSQRAVLSVRPGLTSPASLRFRNEASLLDGPDWEATYLTRVLPAKLAIELEYLHTRTWRRDLVVLILTAAAVLGMSRCVNTVQWLGGTKWQT